jgi:sporulation protein YlmC with PRC-barrel domain
MKTASLAAVALTLGLAFTASGVQAQDRPAKDRPAFTMDANHMDSKYLIGMKVDTPDDKHVGEIDQLVVNMRDGKVTHAIVGLGGLVGVGEKHVVVPWSQVKIREGRDRKDSVAVIDRSALDNAPRYVRTDRDRTPAASPSTTSPSRDRDRDGVPDRNDRAPNNPNKQ